MVYRWHGRASVDSENPQAWATCDRCGSNYNLVNLQWQHDWRGQTLQNLRLLVCDRCLDTPSVWFKTIVLPPDPLPVINARPEAYAVDETDWLSTEANPLQNGIILDTESGSGIVDEGSINQPVSESPG
jgi:hypothetical protein